MAADLTADRIAAGLKALIEQVEALSADYGDDIIDAVRLAREEPLDAADAERLFTRILTILRTTGDDLDDGARQEVAERIRAEASALVSARPAPTPKKVSPDTLVLGGLTFHKLHGLEPRRVLPIQTFNGEPIMLMEGYVDVTTLPLWTDNHRVNLYVEEFREVNHRDPTNDELLELMHGDLRLPSIDKDDPFKLRPLAESIARKGVERAPIVTWEGEPKDGNRRIAASKLVLKDSKFTAEQRDRGRWIRVWQAPEGTTDDQFEAIVVALNFESDHKEDWPEYVKARLVVDRYRSLLADVLPPLNESKRLALRKVVADQFAIKHGEVKRYLEMVQWAEDFEDYHINDRGSDPARVRYKANDIFQWFYEMKAGKGQDKLIAKIQQDDDLRAVVYDLMFDVLDSGAQVRALHKVVADETAMEYLKKAHAEPKPDEALKYVEAAIAEAAKNAPTKQLGFRQFLLTAVDRLGSTPPDKWREIEDPLLDDLRRVFHSAIGTIEGEQAVRPRPVESGDPS
jgi:hypothetical protein